MEEAYLMLGSPDETKNVLIEALLSNPRNPDTLFLLGIIKNSLDKPGEAVNALLLSYEFINKKDQG